MAVLPAGASAHKYRTLYGAKRRLAENEGLGGQVVFIFNIFSFSFQHRTDSLYLSNDFDISIVLNRF